MANITQGGRSFDQSSANGSMVLMGDSNGAMYGKMAKEIGQALRLKVNVISVPAGDPLPHSSGQNPKLWLDSLAFVKREHPDVLVLVCNWAGQLNGEKDRLEIAVNELKQHTRRLILITQPPELPHSGSREAMRDGSRPPFMEDLAERSKRTEANAFVKHFQGQNVVVIDIEPLFSKNDGSIQFIDNNNGMLLYQDGDHLSDVGADQVKPDVIKAIERLGTTCVLPRNNQNHVGLPAFPAASEKEYIDFFGERSKKFTGPRVYEQMLEGIRLCEAGKAAQSGRRRGVFRETMKPWRTRL
jgi:hypothetical protein